MNTLQQVEPDLWPKANYNPVAFISLNPSYFIERLGVTFFTECDDLDEYETCLLKLKREKGDVYFSLFRYINVEDGVNILLDTSLANTEETVEEILTILNVNESYVTLA